MLTMTEAAGAQLIQMLDDAEAPEGVAIRFVHEDEDVALRLDQPKDGDTTLDHEGRTVLVLDPQLAELLADRTLDVQEGEQEEDELVIR
jgi:Fe-S cluster assembly iron-binding protein IscA